MCLFAIIFLLFSTGSAKALNIFSVINFGPGDGYIILEEQNINYGSIVKSLYANKVINPMKVINHMMDVNIFNQNIQFPFGLEFNRVTGLLIYSGVSSMEDDSNVIQPWVIGGYGFSSRAGEFHAGIKKCWLDDNNLETKLYTYNITGTADQNIVHHLFEMYNLIFLRDSFYDYYNRRGITFLVRYSFEDKHYFTIRTHFDEYSTLTKHSNWSLINWKKDLSENSPINDGRIYSIIGSYTFFNVEENRNVNRIATIGWSNTISVEQSGDLFGGDYKFNKYVIDINRYIPFADAYGNFNIGILGGFSDRVLPIQSQFVLGGPHPLRGYRLKEFTADKMVLGKFELVLNTINAYIFSDWGNAWNKTTDDKEGLKNLKGSVGIGWFSGEFGEKWKIYIEIAKGLDSSDRGVNFYINSLYRF